MTTTKTALRHGLCSYGALYATPLGIRCTHCGTEDVPTWSELQPQSDERISAEENTGALYVEVTA